MPICFKDRTFCVSPNCTNECGRKLTHELEQEAWKWWGGDDAPISVAYFCNNNTTDKKD